MWKFWIELIQLVWRQSPLHHSCVEPVMCVVCLTTESQNLCFMANSALEGENAMDKNCASKMYWRDTWRMWISTPKLGRKMQWTESSDNQWSITALPLPNRIVSRNIKLLTTRSTHPQLTVLNATVAVDCAAQTLDLWCINAPTALTRFSVNIACDGLPMMSNVCKKASQRIGAILTLRNLIPTEAKLHLYKAAILPHLTYCHLLRHFCRALHPRRLERVLERELSAVFNDKPSYQHCLIGDYKTYVF